MAAPSMAGDFRVLEALGRGGSAVVYAGEHAQDGTRAAIKVPRENTSAVQGHWFRREASLAARLAHPGIVRLLGSGTLPDRRPYIAFERVEGPALEEVASELSFGEIVAIGVQLLEALSYAHDTGVVHCDVTPNNILLTRTGEGHTAKLADFGLSRTRDPGVRDKVAPALVAGTPGYLSPEQGLGAGGVGPRADLYSAGAVLFRLLTGYAPHSGETSAEVIGHTLHSAPLPLAPRADLAVPEDMRGVVLRLIARDPEHRFGSAARALAAWRAAATGAPAPRGSLAPPPPRVEMEAMETVQACSPLQAPTAPTALLSPSATAATAEVAPMAMVTRSAFVGRERLLVALRSATEADDGLVHVVGPHGVGKSRLVEEVQRGLEADGVKVAWATGRRGVPQAMEALSALALDLTGAGDLGPPWVAAEHLAALLGEAGVFDGDPGRDALVGALVGMPPATSVGTTQLDAFAAFDRLRYRHVGAARMVVVVDDADDLDAGSRGVLRALATTPGARVVVVLITADEAAIEGATRVEVDAFDARERGLLADALGAPWIGAPRLASEVAALPADLEVHAALGRRAGDPTAALGRFTASEAAVLAAAALFGGDIPRRAVVTVAESMAVPDPVDGAALGGLLERGFLAAVPNASARLERWLRMPSPSLAAIALAALAPEARRRGHAAACRWLCRECYDGGAGTRARTAAHAEAAGLYATAAYACTEGARKASAAHDLGASQGLLERALELASMAGDSEDAIDRPAVLASLALLANEAGQPDTVARHAVEALAVIEPERVVLRARLLRTLAAAEMEGGDHQAALLRLDEALALLGDDGDPIELAHALASKGWLLGYLLGRNDEGIGLGRRALEVAARVDAPAFRASLCGKLGANYLRAGDWDGQLAVNREDLELSTRARDVFGVVRANINLGVCFTNRGNLALARAHTERALELAESHGALSAAQIAHNNLALVAVDDGRAEDVERHAAAVLALAARGLRRTLGETWTVLARHRLRQGELDGAEDALLEGAAAADGAADVELVARTSVLLDLARGDVEGALERSARLLATPEHDPYERAASRLTRTAALRAAARTGEALEQERAAAAVLIRLGAKVELERRRWMPA